MYNVIIVKQVYINFPPGATQSIVGVYFTALYRALASSLTRLLDHTQRRATVGRITLNEWSVRRRDLYLTTHNTHNRQTSMHRGGIRTHDRSRRAAIDLHLRRRGYWDRKVYINGNTNSNFMNISLMNADQVSTGHEMKEVECLDKWNLLYMLLIYTK
jgi:hypothetical protein